MQVEEVEVLQDEGQDWLDSLQVVVQALLLEQSVVL
jgi:hypothetical protein